MKFKKQTIQYFNFFRKKNLKKISELFSKNISLSDWNIKINGKSKVIKEYEKIFQEIKNFKLTINRISETNNIVYCEIKLQIKKIPSLEILDVIEFDKSSKIKKITAYKNS